MTSLMKSENHEIHFAESVEVINAALENQKCRKTKKSSQEKTNKGKKNVKGKILLAEDDKTMVSLLNIAKMEDSM